MTTPRTLFLIMCIMSTLGNFDIFAQTIVVTSNADIGAGTLREALQIRAKPGDIINFNINPSTITLSRNITSVSGTSTQPITIDATSQSGGVQLTIAPAFADDALHLGNFNIVQGLTINGAVNAIVSGSNDQIIGNFIGTDPTGATAMPNVRGIMLVGNSNTLSNNVVAASNGIGIQIQSTSASNTISNNTIGTNTAGTDLGNASFGIQVGSANNTIMGNTISFQKQSPGLIVSANNNRITGNTLMSNNTGGIAITGSSNTLSGNDIENNMGPGITISTNASQNVIGATGQGNVISNNTGAGIVVGTSLNDNSIRNQLVFNSIFNNTLLGIDLGNLGVPLTAQANPSNGPNNLQNAPTLVSAILACNGQITVTFSLKSVPSTPYTIQFYKNSVDRNGQSPSITEGEAFIGSTSVTTNASGTVTNAFLFTPLNAVAATDFISATATDAGTTTTGNSSEFSLNIPLSSALIPAVNITANIPSFTLCSGTSITLTANVLNETGTFSYLWSTGATTQSITVTPTSTTTFTVTVTDAQGCQGMASQAVTVNQSPMVSLTSSNARVCIGSSVVLTATPNTFSTYQFFGNGIAISQPQASNTLTTKPTASSTNYTVVATDTTGCTGSSSRVTVTTTPFPQPVLTVSTQRPCVDASIILTAPTGFLAYQFFANGVAIGSKQTANTLTVTPARGVTSYTVTVDASTCQGTSQPVVVNSGPCAVFTIQNCCSKTLFQNDSTTFVVTIQNIGAATATNIVVTDVLPSCFTIQKISGAGWKFKRAEQTITATLPSLAVGQKSSFSVNVSTCCPLGQKPLTTTATVVSDTSVPVSSTATIKII